METENIWEVDSNCSLDEELSKELEELEKQEELQKEQPSIGLRNGFLKTLSNQNETVANGETVGGCKEFGGLVFKNTGVISVAHSHHLSDAYKRKKQRKLLGLTVTGVAADIARREKKRLQYHRMKSDPLFVAKRNEYKKRYRMRQKLLMKMSKAQRNGEDELTTAFCNDGATEGSTLDFGDSQQTSCKARPSSALGQDKSLNGRPSSKLEGFNGVERSNASEDGTNAASNAVPALINTSESAENTTSSKTGAAIKVSTLLGHLYRPPTPASAATDSASANIDRRKKPDEVVSSAKFKHSQMLLKRASSKLVYYQCVLRRDRAIIDHLKCELWKLGKEVDLSQFKLRNYRLKRLENPAEDAMFEIDSAEDKIYRRYIEEVLNRENSSDGDILDDTTFMQQIREMAGCSTPDKSLFPLNSPSGSQGQMSDSVTTSTEQTEKATPPSSGEKIMVPSEDNFSLPFLESPFKIQAESRPKRTDSLLKKPLTCAIVRLKKASVSVKKDSIGAVEPPSQEGVVKKRQIAMKSTRGNVPRRKLQPSPSGCVSLCPPSEASGVSVAYNTDELVQSAISDGEAFTQLRAKLTHNSINNVQECISKWKKRPADHTTSSDLFSTNSNSKKRVSESTSLSDKKKFSPKKIPKELVDGDYYPGGSARLSSPVTDNDDVQVRDHDIYDLFIKFRRENELDVPDLCEAKSVSPKLRQEVVQFVENSTYLERALYNCGNGDESAASERAASEYSDAAQHGSYRDHFVSLLHKRFLATHLRDCSLRTFIECLPRTMERKGALARGFTSCLTCGNAEILFENLIEQKIIDFNHDFENVLVNRKLRANLLESLSKVTDLDRNLACFSWLKSLKGNFARSLKSVSETVGSLVASFKEELTRLDEHLEGVYVKYYVMRAALNRCEQNTDEAMVHITWCENPKVYSRSAYNHITVDQNISLLSGYVWTAQKEYSFASLSDQRDHSTSVLWSHIEDALHDVVLLGYNKLFIISDPPMNHFRNKANFYYMNEFAVKRNVQIRWLFSASYHTYLTADFTGLKIKEMIEKNTQSTVKIFGNNPYQNSSDLISMLQPLTDTSFYLAKKEDIEANVSSLPELQTIKGTQNFAEVLIAPGKFYVKLDSADEYWTKVLVVF